MRSGIEYGRMASVQIAQVGEATGISLSGLRVAFEVSKTSSSQANTANVKIWNLIESTRKKIITKKTLLILRAGYGDDATTKLPHLAAGVIQRVEHSPQPPEVLTEVELRDGGLGLDESMFRRAYSSGTKVSRIVDDLLASMPDVSRGAITASALDRTLPAKRCFSGNARVCLDVLANAYGFEWSVQDGAAQVIDRIQGVGSHSTAIVLSKDTGMIGSPTITNVGCKVDSLLQPAIVPGCFVKVESDYCSGFFKALTVKHYGDTWSGDWKTETEAKAIDKWVGPGSTGKNTKKRR